MKKPPKKLIIYPAVFGISVLVILIIIDVIVLPFYISASEYKLPDVVGKNKDEAIEILKGLNLNPIISTSRFDDKYPKNHVIFQKPGPSSVVKEGRRVYLTISGGEQLVKVPMVINKTLRDAQLTLERNDLLLGIVDSVESEFPADIICVQQYNEGREIPKGTTVNLSISLGPRIGMIRVPNILGKSLIQAENLLKSNSLKIGMRTYITSSTLLPNIVVDQQPSENTLVQVGDSVNVVLTQSK